MHDTSPPAEFLVSSGALTATLIKLLVCTLKFRVKLMSLMPEDGDSLTEGMNESEFKK
jgi:hypothetical protein